MIIQKIIFGNSSNIERRSIVLNMLSGIVNAFQAIAMQMIVTRLTGLSDAGILTIAFAVSNLLMTVGKFGMRNFQVTDNEQGFTFATYLKSRLITLFAMCILNFAYAVHSYFFRQIDLEKVLVVFFICLIYAVDTIEDVFSSEYQKRGRLDVGSAMFILRWVATIAIFALTLLLSKNLLYSVFASLLVAIISSFCMVRETFRYFGLELNCKKAEKSKELLKKSLPLCVGSFLMIYLANAPKYEIELYLSDEIQACYGFVAMPVFVIELINNFLYQPKLIHISRTWNEKNYKEFIKYVVKQCVVLAMVIIFCEVGASIFGIPVLSLMYNTDLSQYKNILLILLIGGGMLAYIGFFAVLLTVMRKQNWMMYGYIIIGLITKMIMPRIVLCNGVVGAAVAFVISLSSLATILCIFVIVNYIKKIRS